MTSGEPPHESVDVGGLDELSPAECWQLLASQPVGRVAVIVGHYPVVFPVNYTVDDKTIL
jgi:nitroimidazol reductase NimA-like FMN-containing flavoprotein (pyridoxamine 5'-phosphate oxidase superfamily)